MKDRKTAMPNKPEETIKQFKIDRPFSMGVTTHSTLCGSPYTTGEMITKDGIVVFYGQENHSRFDFAYRGKQYISFIRNKTLSQQQLVRRASKFAREVVAGKYL